MQHGYGFKAPQVKGYAGSRKRGGSAGVSTNNNTTHYDVHIHINGDVYGIDDLNKKIKAGAKMVVTELVNKRYTGV